MKYSKEELINHYTNKLLQNANFVNHWMNEGFTFYNCYTALMDDTEIWRNSFRRTSTNYLRARAKEELNVLLVGFEVEEENGAYNWTEERYNQVCRWLDELTERDI